MFPQEAVGPLAEFKEQLGLGNTLMLFFLVCTSLIKCSPLLQTNTQSSDKFLGLRPGSLYYLFLFAMGFKDSTCFIPFLNLTLTKLTLCVANTNMNPLTHNIIYSKMKQNK